MSRSKSSRKKLLLFVVLALGLSCAAPLDAADGEAFKKMKEAFKIEKISNFFKSIGTFAKSATSMKPDLKDDPTNNVQETTEKVAAAPEENPAWPADTGPC